MFRALFKKDFARLVSIEESVHVVPWTLETFEHCYQANYPGWVFEIEKKIIGFVIVSVNAEECHILNIGVDRAYQRQGYGRSLMEYAMAESRKKGAMIGYLEVRESNSRAIRLYQNLGFIQIGVRKDYYPVPTGREDALVFAKDMKAS